MAPKTVSTLLTMKDIVNIEKAYGFKGVEYHPNNSMNVALWVEEIRKKGADNTVLLYTPQGHRPPTDFQYLDNDHFVLILQALLQCAMMKEFGNTIIFVDFNPIKEDIQKDMDHLYVLLHQCTHEDILQ